MKYTVETIIELPRDEVIKKLDNVENMKHWQQGLVSAEHLSGTPGEVGSKMKLSYEFGKRKMDLVETITSSNFPEEFQATYETKGVYNLIINRFEKTAEGHTKWVSENNFTPTSFMLRMMTAIMPGAFKKQSKKYLDDFKNFAEKGDSVAKT